jgi:Mlc titration factor MtfA (ptsG expression regulator)
VRHEFAHAYEDCWSQKRQRRNPLSVELWYRFEQTRRGFVTAYASTQPAEYFAESVEAFFAPNLREQLRQVDPEMFAYLTELLGDGLH